MYVLFAFLGGVVVPYSQSEVFYTSEEMKKDYAGATEITEYQVFANDGVELPKDISSKLIRALVKKSLQSRLVMVLHLLLMS